MSNQRLENEIEHGKYLLKHGAGEVWNWETPAGKKRWSRRVKMLTQYVEKGMRVLEIGCGTGYFTKELAKTDANIIAIDISPDLLEAARSIVAAQNVTFEVMNAYAMTYEDASFDVVVGSSVLHHLEVDEALSEFYRVLKPGGRVVFTEPNMMNPQIAVQKNVPYVKEKMGDSPDETAFFRWSLKKTLNNHGFAQIQIDTFDFLHPQIPAALIGTLEPFCMLVEKIPLLREIAGSLYIRGIKE